MMQNLLTTNSITAPRTLSLDALRSFVSICETQSFRATAQRVNKSPSAVSLHINKLEEQLGARLFERDARHVSLTKQGEVLLGQARQLLRLSDETIALFHRPTLVGQLCLMAPHDLGVSLVPNLLKKLAEIHPNIHIDVRLGTSHSIRNGFTKGHAQVILLNDIGTSAIPSQDLFSEPLKWLCLRGGQAATKDPLPLALAEIGCAWRDAALQALHRAGRAYRVAYSSDTSMGQLAAIRADLAIAALPGSLADRDLVPVAPDVGLPNLPMTHIRIADDGSTLARACVTLIFEILRPLPLGSKPEIR